MADIRHSHAKTIPVERDGVSYRGIVWSVVIMAVTLLLSWGLMFGTFTWLQHDTQRADGPRAPLATAQGQLPPQPNLMYLQSGSPAISEPGHLEQFLERENAVLHGYAYDRAAGTARIPVDRAKALLLERGLPVREAVTPAAPAAAK